MSNLFEQLGRIKVMMGVSKLITEASKKQILISKIGLSQENADMLDSLCGQLSVWMANKLIQYQKDIFKSWEKDVPIDKIAVDKINENRLPIVKRQSIQSIMDYIRVGLNGNTSTIKDLSFKDLIEKSKEWHDSLGVGEGLINYKEENPIILDFRDSEGNGFYWADLQTNDCDEESKRMGHCGRTSRDNTIYSLRETKKIPGGKYSINKSHLTAAIGDNDGIIYQLKGAKNSKPKPEFHKYITPLFYVLGGGGEEDDYLIQGFGSEYASSNDFKITDLPKDDIVKLYNDRPELFKGRKLMKMLQSFGIEVNLPSTKFTIDINPDRIDEYISGGWIVRKRKDKRDIDIFETILSGDVWDLWQNYDADWKSSLEYYVDSENEKKIWELIKKMTEGNSDINLDDYDLEGAIKEFDDNYEIRNAISSATNNAEGDDYVNYLYGELKNVLEEYGKVIKMDDTGVELEIDLDTLTNYMSDEDLEEYYDSCDNDVECVFKELVYGDIIDKPKFVLDDRWYPDVNKRYFNEILSDRLSDI